MYFSYGERDRQTLISDESKSKERERGEIPNLCDKMP